MIEEQVNGVRLMLPWPDKVLMPNVHAGWKAKLGAKQTMREACYILAKQTGVTLNPERRYQMTLVFCPPDRRSRDLDNLVAAMKSGIDGMCRALRIDDKQVRPLPDWGPLVEYGKVECTLEMMKAEGIDCAAMQIKLTYGDGFSGRTYYMQVCDKWYQLGNTNPGGLENETKARETAKRILSDLGVSENIDDMQFTWNGKL